ncbi:protein NUCLEAR FUSION DEFECTIVE 4-like isoform X1 [Cynara cardunculus var. scolymus]|uniref:protein NUCLEAR FUSION DEFECTIVE 4-like isoform X1 n=1 Tax=Cynara cardunculus var. scolymus TaxID=59895 RepID=UPI000D62BC08|nr:protein NUCLEAR FUSION DEFECTIVE 4-like isoform X1 [Cynara cardunculus var. scolymus]
MLGVANDIGENVGILPGIFYNKFPTWVVLFIGALCCFSGYGVIWLALTHTIDSLPYWLLWIALCVATNSNAWFTTAVLATNMRNFPLSRGIITGILKGYGGLGAVVYTEIYAILLHKSSSMLLLFLALVVPALSLVLMYFVKPCVPSSADNSSDHAYFLFIQAASIMLGIYLLTTTILSDMFSLSSLISWTFLVFMVILLMAPLAIPIKMTFYPSTPPDINKVQEIRTDPLLEPTSSRTDPGSYDENDGLSDVDSLLAERRRLRPRRGDDFKFSEALIKADFWLLFLVYFVGVGSGVTVLNNLAQIGIAQGVHNTAILLCLFGFCNFVGRLSGGAISEHFARSRSIPRTVWMTCTQVLMIVTYLMFASAIRGTLYATTSLLGICYGVQFSIMIPTTSELFGLKNFSIFYNVISLGNPLGAFLFSGLLAGNIYDYEVSKQNSVSCLGPNCFRLTFFVLAGLCSVGTILSIILTRRLKPVYELLYGSGSFRLRSPNH